uniref:germ cell-specific gene 1-like protein n=1 Tax=Myxine glutinosa TaxID=7769 RepID=UPI00358E856E
MRAASRTRRTALAVTLNASALLLCLVSVSTTAWCRGTRKVPKAGCGLQRGCAGANASGSSWQSGDDKFDVRAFRAGFWLSCEDGSSGQGELCRRLIDLVPATERSVMWLAVMAEALFVGLLGLSVVLLSAELFLTHSKLTALKLNAFGAVTSVLAGLLGMVAHMMYTTVFQVTVSLGPDDWRPHSWDYSWSFSLAWLAFACTMAASVTVLNSYTKTLLEVTQRRHSTHVPLTLRPSSLLRFWPSLDKACLQPLEGKSSISPDSMSLQAWSPNQSLCVPVWETFCPPNLMQEDPACTRLDLCRLWSHSQAYTSEQPFLTFLKMWRVGDATFPEDKY